MGIINRIKRFFISKTSEDAMEDMVKEQRVERIEKRAREISEEEEARKRAEEQATGRGGSTILPPVIVLHMSKGSFWAWFFLLLVGLAILWYFTGWKIYIFWIIVGFGILWILIGIGATASAISKGRDYATFFWITCALIIWALDMVPANFPVLGSLLGEPWGGFEWYGGIFDISWGSIITSSLVFALLYVNMVYNIVKHEVRSFVLAFITILVLNNLIARFFPNSLGYNIPVPYASVGFIIFLVFVIGGFVLAIYLDKRLQSEIPNFFSYLFMIFVFSFFWVNTGWTNNWRAILHAIFIIGFGFEYIRPKERQNPAIWHIAIPSLLILDFFGYGALFSSDYLWVKFIPVLVISVIMYCYAKTENWYAIFSLVIIVTIILILSLQITAYEGGTFQFRQRTGGTDFKQFFGTLGGKLTGIIEGRLDIATAGLYRGSVEKNRYESLGVYFANIRASDPRFYDDEPITVWSSIRSKTYKDPVIINFSCYRWKDNKRIYADKSVPEIKFPIFQLEEVDTECTFLPPKLEDKAKEYVVGANIVTLSAEYNFATDSYLKTYFIDRDRFKSYSRETIEPLTEFGIKDKKPSSVSTNGPVEIGIGAGPLVPVSSDYAGKPLVGITLTNRQQIEDKDKRIIQKWDGKIRNITELVLLAPPGITLEKNPSDADPEELKACKLPTNNPERLKCPCNFPFKKYNRGDCQNSCSANILIPCKDVCDEVYKKDSNGKDSCVNDCASVFTNCNTECDNLFNLDKDEGNGKYNGYALDVGSLEFRDLNKDIDKHRTFACRYNIDPSKLLDSTPLTTRYFRVRARYNYVAENSVTVNVEKPPVGTVPKFPIGTPEFYSKIPETFYEGTYYNEKNDNEKRYSGLVFKYAKENNVDYLFVKAIIQQENPAWNPSISGDGGNSIGLMQVSKGTATGLGCDASKLFDPEENIKCGVKFIRGIIDDQKDPIIKSDPGNIAAAYNCGPKALRQDTVYGLLWKNPESCWNEPIRTTNTRIYVEKVIGYYNKMKSQLVTATAGGGLYAP